MSYGLRSDCIARSGLSAVRGAILCRFDTKTVGHAGYFFALPGVFPEFRGDRKRVDALGPPPTQFGGSPMEFIVVDRAKGNHEFVADLLRQTMALGKFEVMGVGGLAATNQTGLG